MVLRREVMNMGADGKELIVLQLTLESWDAAGYQRHNGFSHEVAYIESWKSVKPTADAYDRGRETTNATKETRDFIEHYTSLFEISSSRGDPLQEYQKCKKAHDECQMSRRRIRKHAGRKVT